MARTVGDGGRPAIRGTPLERVMRYVQYDTAGGCWLWDSGFTSNGFLDYPIFTLRPGKQQRVNRFMCEAFNGEIPAGMIVRHTCDVSMCVNPAHLVVGSHSDNAQDRERRGRGRSARPKKPYCIRGHALTEDNIQFGNGGARNCKICARDRMAARRNAQRVQAWAT